MGLKDYVIEHDSFVIYHLLVGIPFTCHTSFALTSSESYMGDDTYKVHCVALPQLITRKYDKFHKNLDVQLINQEEKNVCPLEYRYEHNV